MKGGIEEAADIHDCFTTSDSISTSTPQRSHPYTAASRDRQPIIAMSLLGLPVELQTEIYGYVLNPGFITARRTGADLPDSYCFTRQRSGRNPKWNVVISAHGMSQRDRAWSDLYERRRIFAKIVVHWIDRAFQTPSRYLQYQVDRLLKNVREGTLATAVDCSVRGLTARLIEQERTQRWCLCQFCSNWVRYEYSAHERLGFGAYLCGHSSTGSFPFDEKDQHNEESPSSANALSEPPLLELGLLRVCKEIHAIGKDLVWQNVFHFEAQADLEMFLGMLSEQQRKKMKRVQIAKEVVVLL